MLRAHGAVAHFHALLRRVREGGVEELRKYGCRGLWVSLKLKLGLKKKQAADYNDPFLNS